MTVSLTKCVCLSCDGLVGLWSNAALPCDPAGIDEGYHVSVLTGFNPTIQLFNWEIKFSLSTLPPDRWRALNTVINLHTFYFLCSLCCLLAAGRSITTTDVCGTLMAELTSANWHLEAIADGFLQQQLSKNETRLMD